jgi:cerevisin
VLGEDGSGSISDIISGMNWVSQTAANTGRPSIVSMSLGGSASRPLDQAVATLTRRGVHVVVAAGNDNEDASNSSPARALSANSVGSARINDARSGFSNFGSVLELFAPGENIISTWNKEPGVESLSGTSMACPHVAGALALLISISGNDTPAVWQAKLKSLAVKNALTNIREYRHCITEMVLLASHFEGSGKYSCTGWD